MAATSIPLNPASFVSADEHFISLIAAGPFDRLLRKDDLLDEGVAAVFGVAGGTAQLLGLCFEIRKFTPDGARAWLTDRGFSPHADTSTPKSQSPPLP